MKTGVVNTYFLIIPKNPPYRCTLKLSKKKAIQKTAKATGDLIGNKIADWMIEVSKTLQQNISETVTNEHDKEISKER